MAQVSETSPAQGAVVVKTAINYMLEADKKKQVNCFELGASGQVVEGIMLAFDKGPDPLRPWTPFILLGSERRVHRDDRYDPKTNKNMFGAIFHPDEERGGVVRRAALYRVNPPGGKSYYTLIKPLRDDVKESLIKVKLGLPEHIKLVREGYNLNIMYGVHGTAHAVASSEGDFLVVIGNGQTANLLFGDGTVRQFVQQETELKEVRLNMKQIASVRVEHALARLQYLAGNEDDEKLESKLKQVLGGMADLLYLTQVDKVAGQELRRFIIQEFFLKVSDNNLRLVHKKLTAVLYKVDSALLPLLKKEPVHMAPVSTSTGASTPAEVLAAELATPDTNVVDLSVLREKFNVTAVKKGPPAQAKARKSARSAADKQALAEKQKGAPARGGKPAIVTNPDKAKKIARKQAAKK